MRADVSTSSATVASWLLLMFQKNGCWYTIPRRLEYPTCGSKNPDDRSVRVGNARIGNHRTGTSFTRKVAPRTTPMPFSWTSVRRPPTLHEGLSSPPHLHVLKM